MWKQCFESEQYYLSQYLVSFVNCVIIRNGDSAASTSSLPEFWYFFSQKIGKNTKLVKIPKIKNEPGVMYCLIYIFSDFIVDIFIF